MPLRVAFTTCAVVPELSGDDRLAIPALRALGVEVVPWVWEAPAPPGLDAVVHRSCWDYHEKSAAFLAWLDALEASALPSFNAVPAVRWNVNKRYLRDLTARGVAVQETAWLDAGERVDLAALLRARGLDEVVIKPQISLSAFATSRASRATAAEAQASLDAIGRERAMMVQAFLPEVIEHGELSFVFFGGQHSHTVRKRPRPGDFRVQQDHGGSRAPVDATPALIAEAARMLAAAETPLLYARVDAVETRAGLVLMELEAIDPELFLALEPAAPTRFAAAIAAALTPREGRGPHPAASTPQASG
jgi:glutathione synthase/RimK-type ligase-like ATP-grasp enzyme